MRFFVSSSVGCFSYLFTYICRFFSSHWTSLKIKRRSKGGCIPAGALMDGRRQRCPKHVANFQVQNGAQATQRSQNLISLTMFDLFPLVIGISQYSCFMLWLLPILILWVSRLSRFLFLLLTVFLRCFQVLWFFVFVTYTFHIVWTITSPEVLKDPWEKQGPSSNKLN